MDDGATEAAGSTPHDAQPAASAGGGAPGGALLAETAELVSIPSVSHQEHQLADFLEARLKELPGMEVVRVADNIVARTRGDSGPRLLLAGHMDTVPAAGNQEPTLQGETLWGLGSADMKGGLAVMLDIARAVSGRPGPLGVQLSVVMYACEEVAREHSGLWALAEEAPGWLEADAAVVCEPTSAVVEAGCQGVLKAALTLRGVRAHVARPWAGRNAIHRLGPVLSFIGDWVPRQVTLQGCTFRESLQVVHVSGGVASNVLPDVATIAINHRFAPDRSVAQAAEALRELLRPWMDAGDVLEVTDSAPAAPPSLDAPLLRALVAGSGSGARAKLGWTDVAFFTERGVPAVNFGPGDSEVAHSPDERVELASLRDARSALGALLGV